MNLCITIRWILGEFHLMKSRIKLKLILKTVYSTSNNQIVLSYIVENVPLSCIMQYLPYYVYQITLDALLQ